MNVRVRHWYIFAAALGVAAPALALIVEYYKAQEFYNTVHRAQAVADRASDEYYRMIRPQISSEKIAKPFITLERDGLDLNLESEITQVEHTIGAKISEYSVGGYRMDSAPSAQVSIAFFKIAISDVFTEFNENGVEASTLIVGTADGIPIRQGAVYVGDLGNIINLPYYSRNKSKEVNINLETGDSVSNEEIAFLRAYAILQELQEINFVSHSVRIETETTHDIGGGHRRVVVRMHLKNALARRYSQLSPIARKIEEHL